MDVYVWGCRPESYEETENIKKTSVVERTDMADRKSVV